MKRLEQTSRTDGFVTTLSDEILIEHAINRIARHLGLPAQAVRDSLERGEQVTTTFARYRALAAKPADEPGKEE